jgi:hypothetical protein
MHAEPPTARLQWKINRGGPVIANIFYVAKPSVVPRLRTSKSWISKKQGDVSPFAGPNLRIRTSPARMLFAL